MAEELRDIRDLLHRIEDVNKRYAEVKRAYENSGVLYNIFEVLGLTTSEVGLHSTFIASLLRSGQHGAGTKFLEAFLRMPRLGLPADFFDIDNVKVEQEKRIGTTTDDEGGRIDLILSDGNNTLIIENKIYAKDQWHQLLRYHNYRPSAKLVYLSLYADDEPSDDSLGTLDRSEVTTISYEYDMLLWLEECVRISANLPHIRETLNQYIRTIQLLTNTGMGTNSDIIKLLKAKENLEAAFAIRENLDSALNDLMKQFVSDLKQRVEQSPMGFTFVTENSGNDSFFMDKPKFLFKHSDWKNVCFAMEFEHSGLRDLAIGFLKNPEVKDIRLLDGVKKLADSLDYNTKSTVSWFWSYPSSAHFRNWYNAKSMDMLHDGSMLAWFMETLNNVFVKSKGLDL